MAHAPNRRNTRSLVKETSGAVYVEFLIAFIPFFIMVLGMMQIALMYSAHLVVQHAAATAARAAVVVFPDCDAHYDGARQNDVNGGGRGDSPASILGRVFGAGSAPSTGFPSSGGSTGGARLDAIRFATSFPLTATSPSLDELRNGGDPRRSSVIDAIGGTSSPVLRLAVGALAYNNVAMAVTFPQAPRSSTFNSRFSNRQPITARVTYLFHCGVPIVSTMACDNAAQLFSGVPLRQIEQAARGLSSGRLTLPEVADAANRVNVARDRLAAARPGLNELDSSGTGYSLSAILLAASGGNYSVLRAEATLPNQGAEAGTIGRPCYNVTR